MGHTTLENIYPWVKQALKHLYDPTRLKNNPLFDVFGFQSSDSPTRFSNLLLTEIESLKPNTAVSSQSMAWRTYHILNQRYIDQFSQNEVALNVGLSIRQLRRQERIALESLSQKILMKLSESAFDQLTTHSTPLPETHSEDQLVSRNDELAWLEHSQPNEELDLGQLTENALQILQPIAVQKNVQMVNKISRNHSLIVLGQQTSLQQVLINLITVAIQSTENGNLVFTTSRERNNLKFSIDCHPVKNQPGMLIEELMETLSLTQELTQLSEADLSWTVGAEEEGLTQIILLFSAKPSKVVLTIDDNQDVLQLYTRFLANTVYTLQACSDPENAVALASRIQPDVIIIDVMLPNIDGWELLSSFREHPNTKDTPTVICTILPQSQLALMLGAASFLKKPFTRQQLLNLLDQLTSAPEPEHGSTPQYC